MRLAIAVALTLLLCTAAVAAAPLCVFTPADRAANARLNFDAFDQRGTAPSTWRALSNRNCNDSASAAMADYLIDGPVTDPTQRADLRFHLGQTLAMSGRNAEAAVAVLSADTGGGVTADGLDWNTYVVGTWAFLTRDKPRLKAAWTRLTKQPGRGNHLNAAALLGLIACYGRPYIDAYQRACRAAR